MYCWCDFLGTNIKVIRLKNSSKKIYDVFIARLKQAINHKAHGARVKINEFINYPIKLLEGEIASNENIFFWILDWKYQNLTSFLSENKRVKQDIVKQLCYEFALQQNYPNHIIESQFVIPYFYPDNYDDLGDFIEDKQLIDNLKDNEIRVFKANFMKIQQIYLSEL